MTKMNFNRQDVLRLKQVLSDSRKIVITCHLSPDGDALGSSLGLKCILASLNPKATVNVVTPDEPTHTLSFLKDFKTITPLSRNEQKAARVIAQADLIVCLDFNQLSRTDLLAPYLRGARAVKVLIDHHLEPEDFADITFSYPEKCATCMLLYQLIEAAGLSEYIDASAADCLLAGMMTDTGDFSYNVCDPGIYAVVGNLIGLGADKGRLTRLLFNTFSESHLRIQGYALAEKMEVFKDSHAALIYLTRDELNRFGYKKGDTEGLVNRPLSIPGVLYSCYLRDETDYIKVSMRSLGKLPVNEICRDYFEGGGHLNAAGGEFKGSMNLCIDTFKKSLPETLSKYITGNKELEKILEDEN